MLKTLLVLWVIAMCQPADAGVLGAFKNDAGGATLLLDDQPTECGGAYRVESRDSTGAMRHAGCYAVHNGMSVVILWDRGPAVVVRTSAVDWVEQAEQQVPKAIAKPSEKML